MHSSVIFTCGKHLEAAEIAAQAASRFSKVHFIIDRSEKGLSSTCPIIWSDWNRGGNLNGYDAVMGVANAMLSVSDSGYVMKIDSDTLVNDPYLFTSYDIAGFPQSKRPPALLGCCYMISKRALMHAITCIEDSPRIGILEFAEDACITGYARTMTGVSCFNANIIPLRRLGVWCPVAAPLISQNAPAANFGNVRINGEWHHKDAISAMKQHLARSIDKSQPLHP